MSEQRNLVLRQNLALSNLKSCPAFVTNTIENPEQAKCGGIFCKFPVIFYNTTKGNFAKPALVGIEIFPFTSYNTGQGKKDGQQQDFFLCYPPWLKWDFAKYGGKFSFVFNTGDF